MSKAEYRTIDTTTLKGLREAERLHKQGWQQVRVGPFTTQFRRVKSKVAPPAPTLTLIPAPSIEAILTSPDWRALLFPNLEKSP